MVEIEIDNIFHWNSYVDAFCSKLRLSIYSLQMNENVRDQIVLINKKSFSLKKNFTIWSTRKYLLWFDFLIHTFQQRHASNILFHFGILIWRNSYSFSKIFLLQQYAVRIICRLKVTCRLANRGIQILTIMYIFLNFVWMHTKTD